MKNLKDTIIEKLNIKNINLPNKDKIMINNIVNYLSDWLLKDDIYTIPVSHKRYKTNRFTILTKYFDKKILDILDYFQGEFETMSEKLQINISTLSDFINDHNDEIFDKCEKKFHKYWNILSF